jgi:hypothetical protein
MGHLSDIVKRRRTRIHRFPVQSPNACPVSVIQSRPDGVSSVQFSNLLSRLLEQVPLSPNGDALANKYMCSPFYHANMSRSCFYIHWHLQQQKRLSSLLPYSLLSHLHLLLLLSTHQLFRLLMEHHYNRRERGNLKQSSCGKCGLDPV